MDKEMKVEDLFSAYAKTRDIQLRDRLVLKHLHIAEILAKKYTGRGVEYDDLYQVASIALISAVERFDVSKGFAFSSFATPTIIGEIKKYFRDKGWMIRVPRRLQELSKRVSLARNELSVTLARAVRVKDIADHLGVSEEEVMEAMEVSYVYSPASLDGAMLNSDSDEELDLTALIGNEDDAFAKLENKDYLENCLSKLDEIEAKLIRSRFIDGMTQVEVAKMMGVSQMTVSRLENKLLTKMRSEYYKICG